VAFSVKTTTEVYFMLISFCLGYGPSGHLSDTTPISRTFRKPTDELHGPIKCAKTASFCLNSWHKRLVGWCNSGPYSKYARRWCIGLYDLNTLHVQHSRTSCSARSRSSQSCTCVNKVCYLSRAEGFWTNIKSSCKRSRSNLLTAHVRPRGQRIHRVTIPYWA
jgi:hypothetical protein